MVLDNFINQSAPGSVWHSLFSTLGFEEMSAEDGTVSAVLPAAVDFRQNHDSGLAPAWLTVALDTLLGMAVFSKILKPVPIATIDLSTDFLSDLLPNSNAVVSASCDSIAGNIAFVSGSVRDSTTNTEIARCRAKFIIKQKPPKNRKKNDQKSETPAFPSQTKPNDHNRCSLFEQAKEGHPYANWLAVDVFKSEDENLMYLPFREQIIGDPFARTIHGGMLASLMELTAANAIIETTGTPHLLAPLSNSINYLKRTVPVACFASADIERHGRNIIVVHTRCWQFDPQEPAASATFLFKGMGEDNKKEPVTSG